MTIALTSQLSPDLQLYAVLLSPFVFALALALVGHIFRRWFDA